jgi:hypothetical protein
MLHHRLRFRSAAALIVSTAALIVPAIAQAKTETVTSGGVTATFSYHKASFGYKGAKVAISRGGKTVYSAVINIRGCGHLCWPGNLAGGKSVHVLELGHNGREDVVLDLFSGGAHCCWYEQVLYPSGASYKVVTRYFGDVGTGIADLRHNGRFEFDSDNPSFSGLYTSFAASGFPIQILTFSNGKFHDVTRSYPKLIKRNAADLLKDFKMHYNDGEGLIAPWTADEYMLGRKAQALAYLNAQAKAGHLNALGSSLRGHKFVVQLQKDLKRLGY